VAMDRRHDGHIVRILQNTSERLNKMHIFTATAERWDEPAQVETAGVCPWGDGYFLILEPEDMTWLGRTMNRELGRWATIKAALRRKGWAI